MGWLPFFEFERPPARDFECVGGPLDGQRVGLKESYEYKWYDLLEDGSRVVHTYYCRRDRRGDVVLEYESRKQLPPPRRE